MKKFVSVMALSFAAPLMAAAQTTTSIRNLDSIFIFIRNVLNTVLPLIIALAVVYFVWGMFQVFLAGDEEKKDKAKTTVIYGVIAIFVMVSIWGLVNILSNTFNLDKSVPATPQTQLPQVPL